MVDFNVHCATSWVPLQTIAVTCVFMCRGLHPTVRTGQGGGGCLGLAVPFRWEVRTAAMDRDSGAVHYEIK